MRRLQAPEMGMGWNASLDDGGIPADPVLTWLDDGGIPTADPIFTYDPTAEADDFAPRDEVEVRARYADDVHGREYRAELRDARGQARPRLAVVERVLNGFIFVRPAGQDILWKVAPVDAAKDWSVRRGG